MVLRLAAPRAAGTPPISLVVWNGPVLLAVGLRDTKLTQKD